MGKLIEVILNVAGTENNSKGAVQYQSYKVWR